MILDDTALYHLGGHLAVVNRRIQRADEIVLAPFGLSSAQARVIRALARRERAVPMSELASILDIVPRSATSVVEELESMGYVERSPDPTDGRRVLVDLTARSRAISAELADVHGRAVATALTGLDPDEIAVLGDLLQRLAHTPGDD